MEFVIKNGTVVSSKETKQADIYIKDGKIASIKPYGSFDKIKDRSDFLARISGRLTV